MNPTSLSNNSRRRRPASVQAMITTGLVATAAALLVWTAPVEAARRINDGPRRGGASAAAAGRQLEHVVKEQKVVVPSEKNDPDLFFAEGSQCVKCCGSPPEPKEPKEPKAPGVGPGPDGAEMGYSRGDGGEGGSDGEGTGGGSGKGKGKGGTGPSGGGNRKLKTGTKTRRLVGRSKKSKEAEVEAEANVHTERKLMHPLKTDNCVKCSEGEKKCLLHKVDFETLLTSENTLIPSKAKCDLEMEKVSDCPTKEDLEVYSEFAREEDLKVEAGYVHPEDAAREHVTYVDLSNQGGCGEMMDHSQPTRIEFFVEARHNTNFVTSTAEVAQHLQANIGPAAFCPSENAAEEREPSPGFTVSAGFNPNETKTESEETPAEQTESEPAEVPAEGYSVSTVYSPENKDMSMTVSAATASPGGRRKLQEGSPVIGFVPCGDSYAPSPNRQCAPADRRLQADQANIQCNIYSGQVCVHCDADVSNPECFAAGVNMLKENASGAADPPRIVSVKVVGAAMSSEITGNAGGDVMGVGGSATTNSILGAETSNTEEGNGLGIALGVGLGLCALLIILLAARKNRKAYTRDISFLDEEDMYSVDGDNIHLKPGDSSFDGTEIMSEGGSPSPKKWRKSRPGHIVGEDDSILSGDNKMVPRDLHFGSETSFDANPHDLAMSPSGVDVHQCNSAMCEICLARGANPRFIPSNLEDVEIDNEGRLNTSDLSYASRTYPMEDTVDF